MSVLSTILNIMASGSLSATLLAVSLLIKVTITRFASTSYRLRERMTECMTGQMDKENQHMNT